MFQGFDRVAEFQREMIIALHERPGATFGSLLYVAQESGEVARHSIIINASLGKAYDADIATLLSLKESADWRSLTAIERQAVDEILTSRNTSREAWARGEFNPEYTQANTWYFVPAFPAIRIHREAGNVVMQGVQSHKIVITPGEYKEVKSRPLTIAKREIEKRLGLKAAKIRSYRLDNIAVARLNGDTIEFEPLADRLGV